VGVMAAAMIDPEESVYKKRGAISIGDDENESDYEEPLDEDDDWG
jgi:hypothetical protein